MFFRQRGSRDDGVAVEHCEGLSQSRVALEGSLLGGWWSDYKLAKLKKANGGNSYPEVRQYPSGRGDQGVDELTR